MHKKEIKLTWKSTIGALMAVLRDGNAEGRKVAIEEINKCAEAADAYNELIENQRKPEYFLFGEQICRLFDEGYWQEVLNHAEKDGGYEVICFDEEMSAAELLSTFTGWNDYACLTKEEYEQLQNI